MMRTKFQMGWLMVAFDLPVVEDKDRKAATKFRSSLLDLGYMMLQESIYIRNCVSIEKYKADLKKVKDMSPCKGAITAFYLTDKQWENAVNITLSEPLKGRTIKAGQKNPDQLTFW